MNSNAFKWQLICFLSHNELNIYEPPVWTMRWNCNCVFKYHFICWSMDVAELYCNTMCKFQSGTPNKVLQKIIGMFLSTRDKMTYSIWHNYWNDMTVTSGSWSNIEKLQIINKVHKTLRIQNYLSLSHILLRWILGESPQKFNEHIQTRMMLTKNDAKV